MTSSFDASMLSLLTDTTRAPDFWGLNLDALCELWDAFTTRHDLPAQSADEVLLGLCVEAPGQRSADTVVKASWVQAFIEAWGKAEEEDRALTRALGEAEHDAIFGEAHVAPTDAEAEADLARITAAAKPRTINLTPTWAALLPGLLAIYRDATPKGRTVIEAELRRMAEAADLYNAAVAA